MKNGRGRRHVVKRPSLEVRLAAPAASTPFFFARTATHETEQDRDVVVRRGSRVSELDLSDRATTEKKCYVLRVELEPCGTGWRRRRRRSSIAWHARRPSFVSSSRSVWLGGLAPETPARRPAPGDGRGEWGVAGPGRLHPATHTHPRELASLSVSPLGTRTLAGRSVSDVPRPGI